MTLKPWKALFIITMGVFLMLNRKIYYKSINTFLVYLTINDPQIWLHTLRQMAHRFIVFRKGEMLVSDIKCIVCFVTCWWILGLEEEMDNLINYNCPKCSIRCRWNWPTEFGLHRSIRRFGPLRVVEMIATDFGPSWFRPTEFGQPKLIIIHAYMCVCMLLIWIYWMEWSWIKLF